MTNCIKFFLLMTIFHQLSYANILPLRKSHFILLNTKSLIEKPILINSFRSLSKRVASLKKVKTARPELLTESKVRFDYYIDVDYKRGKDNNTEIIVSIYNEKQELVFERKVNLLVSVSSLEQFGTQLAQDISQLFPLEGNKLNINDNKKVEFELKSNRPIDFYLGQKVLHSCRPDCRDDDQEGFVVDVRNEKLIAKFKNLKGLKKSSFIYLSQDRVLDKDILDNPALFQNLNNITITKDLESYYKFSFRSCAILPLVGNVKFLKDVRKKLVKKIKNDARCTLREDPSFIAIFDRYKGIKGHIKNKKVVSTFATKLGTGSNFRISVDKLMMGYRVALDILAENGEETLYREREVLENADAETVSDLLLNWSIRYLKKIPYQALVLEGVEGDIYFDLGQRAIHTNNQSFEIYRPSKLTLKRIGTGHLATWEKVVVGRGLVFQTHKNHSVGRIIRGENKFTRTSVKKGDWVNLTGIDTLKKVKPVFAIHNLKKNREKGRIKLGGNLHQLNSDVKDTKSSSKIFSFSAGLDLFLPYSLILQTEFDRTNASNSGFGFSNNSYNASLGYTSIVEGNMFVSSMDLSLGYLNNFYPLGLAESNFLGDTTVKGLFGEINFEMPIYENMSTHAGIRYAPSLTGKVEDTVLGDLESASVLNTFIDFDYEFTEKIHGFIEYNYESITINQEVDDAKVNVVTSKIKFGAYINF